ncbi:hypothetical protein SAMN05216588_11163 [Pseudomonas flavescens]|uniref:Uncharacterized protein n=1 Tax=Phytopseudomonas flavescens TaxID=29435 RepID=A0A1G8HRC7_9GAMM|nr:hypothetical protein [Pseudomonas flavescens]SDI09031.1 hypothetical protein SAMN05216588_11163 [Pseudomonas flavescens]
MNDSNDPLNGLAQSLTDDLDAHSGARSHTAIEEREHLLQSVPAVLELPCTRKVRGSLVLRAVLLLVIGGLCATVGKVPYLGALLMLGGICLLASLWLHRAAGKAVLLRLTPTTLALRALDREVELGDISELRMRARHSLRITLNLHDGATLPGVRNALGPLMPKAQIKHATPYADPAEDGRSRVGRADTRAGKAHADSLHILWRDPSRGRTARPAGSPARRPITA